MFFALSHHTRSSVSVIRELHLQPIAGIPAWTRYSCRTDEQLLPIPHSLCCLSRGIALG